MAETGPLPQPAHHCGAGLPSLPDEIDPSLAKRIRKAAAEQRIAIKAVSGTFNMIHPDAKQRRDGLHKLSIIAGACEPLGTRMITLCTGTRDTENMWRHHPQNDSPEAWRDLLVSMTKALTIADKFDLSLGVEPETGNVVSSAQHARRLLNELRSPRLKIVIDPANLFHPADLPRMDEIMDEAFDLLGGDIAMAHAKELGADGHAGSLPLGSGVLASRAAAPSVGAKSAEPKSPRFTPSTKAWTAHDASGSSAGPASSMPTSRSCGSGLPR